MVKKVITVYLSEAFVKGASIIVSIILTNYLPVKDYGIYVYASSLIIYVLPISNFGLDTYGLVKNLDRIQIQIIFSIKFYLGVLAFFIYVLCIFILNAGDNIYVKVVLLIFGFRLISQSFNTEWLLQKRLNFKTIAISNLLHSIFFIGGVFLFRDKLLLISVIYSLSYFLRSLVLYWQKRLKKIELNYKVLWGYLKLGLPFFLVVFSQQFMGTFSKVITPHFINEETLAYLDVSLKFFLLFELIFSVGVKFLLPYSVKIKKAVYFYIVSFMIILLIIISFITGIHENIILYFFGDNYSKSVELASVLYPYIVLVILSIAFGNVLYVKGEEKYLAKFNSFAILVNASLIITLIYFYSEMGIVLSLTICKLIEVTAYAWKIFIKR